MSEQLQKIAVVGSLLAANFTVTVISREASSKTFPSNVRVKRVDFQSQSSLTAALQGQDVLVSAIETMATSEQKSLVAAAIEARVKRFIPSEYGLNTRTVGSETKLGKMLGSKIKTVDLLIEQAEMNPWFGWTALGNNLFFDWSLKAGFLGIDIPSKTATIIDSGNEPWSTTNLNLIGIAIVAILKRPTETKNKYLMISSFTTSQNELLAAVEEETGVKFTVTRKAAAQAEVDGDSHLHEGQVYMALWDFVHQYQFADGAGHALAETESANELLGLEGGDLKSSVKKVVSLF